jgi:hypothetical protein
MSENTFKRSLARSTYKAKSESEAKAIIVRRMLNDLDGVLIKYWSALGDMGMSAVEFKKLRAQIKKRL